MFERVLLAVDGSAHSKRALPVAAEIAKRFDAQVTVAHIREHLMSWGADVDLEDADEASELLNGVIRELKEAGVGVTSELRRVPTGLAAHEILAVAAETDAELIVMGTRGLTDWQGLLIGSVAHKVVHHAMCPVLLVR